MASAKYYIVQLVPDLFRREPTNIGIIVEKAMVRAARFVGEKADGIDKRHLKFTGTPDIYVQWIDYWRRLISRPNVTETDLFKANGGNFNVIRGGEVRDTGDDNVDSVLNYLYPLLVTDGGLIEALGKQQEAEGSPNAALKLKVAQAFDAVNILDVGDQGIYMPPHPVRKEVPIAGRLATHNPAYSQNNGHLKIMEVIDFTQRQKSYAKDHAGLSALVFKDIRDEEASTDAVAIIQLPPSLANDPTLNYSLGLLEKTANRIVNWSMMPERERFIAECVEQSTHLRT